jgi:hypothetical protein
MRRSIQNGHTEAFQLSGELADIMIPIYSQAFVEGMWEAIIMGIIAMVVAALEAWIIMPAKPRSLRLTR